ncbi:MAG: hypothetical protein LBQ38_12070 [Spirochaetaceae bacterium]|jgi:hypothetical protein|nr:hypothetical protein [Spirochaetaceae bacterium]
MKKMIVLYEEPRQMTGQVQRVNGIKAAGGVKNVGNVKEKLLYSPDRTTKRVFPLTIKGG